MNTPNFAAHSNIAANQYRCRFLRLKLLKICRVGADWCSEWKWVCFTKQRFCQRKLMIVSSFALPTWWVQLNCLLVAFAWNLVTQKWLIDTLINPTSWFWQEKNVYHWSGPHCAPLILLMLQAMFLFADVLFELTVISSSWLHSIPKTLLMLEPAAKFVKFSPELV